jgi:hypothetical protein
MNTKSVPSGTIAVTVDHRVVYLMGKVTQEEGDYAAAAVSAIDGVSKVVKLFDIMSPEEAARRARPTPRTKPTPDQDAYTGTKLPRQDYTAPSHESTGGA